MIRSRYWLIFILVVIIFFTRLLIFNKDAVGFWADESRYPLLIANLDEAYKLGNYLLPLKQLFNIDARPGAGLFYYPPAFLELQNPNIPFALSYNLIINSLLLILVFFIVKKIQNLKAAIVTTLILTFSIAPLIYIRHTLPYDLALLLLLIGLFLYVYFQKSLLFGLFAGLSFLTYPSYYYYLIPIPFILILYNRSLKSALHFIIGISLIIITTQFLSVSIGSSTSYLQSLKDQSGGVTAIQQGDYMPAASYIGEYILAVDGYWNLLLILIIFPGIFLIKSRKKILFFAIYLMLVLLILETFSHILQKHVLFGRTVRPLYLLTLGFSGLLLERVFSKRIYSFALGIILIITFLNHLPRFLAYKSLIYPAQFKQTARSYLDVKYDKYEIEDTLFVNYWDSENPDPELVWHFFKGGESGKYYTMNAVQTFPYFGNFNMDEFCKNEVLLKEPHIQYIFQPYQFEGYKKVMREKMEKDPLYYQLIYCKI
ncbi:MAG: hypothetical protein AAB414_02435 [Patescibacteria group bacterium]